MRIKPPKGVVECPPALRIVFAIIFLLLAIALLRDAVASAATRTTDLSECRHYKTASALACEFLNGILRAIPESARWILSGVGGTVGAVVFLYAAFQLFSSAVCIKRDS